MIVCVVDDPKLDDILNAIANTACTNTKGDGKVFVTTVDDALDVCTKKRGHHINLIFVFFVVLVSF